MGASGGCFASDSIQTASVFGVFVLSWAQRELGAPEGGCMGTGSDLDGSGEDRVEVWPEGLLIQPGVGVLLGVPGDLGSPGASSR